MDLSRFVATSLVRRALLPITVALAGFAMVVAFAIAQMNIAEAERMLEEKAQRTAGVAALGLQEALWNFSPDLAAGVLGAVAEDPDFLSGVVFDDSGGEFARHGTASSEQGVVARRDIVRAADGDPVVIGVLELTLSRTRSEAAAKADALRTLAAGALILTVVVAFLVVVLRRVIRPISQMTDAMTRLSRGDLDVPIPATSRADELGAMARAVQVFKDNAVAKRRLEAEQAETERRAVLEKRQAMLGLAESFESSVGGVIEAVSDKTTAMERKTQGMADAAAETDKLAAAVSAATTETASNVQAVAIAAEQLSASITEIGRQVADASRISTEAVTHAQSANAKVGGLAEAVERIGAVVDLINSIAERTNLLALNATIEAARAGEAGKGFAVVAGEVKALATQTGQATGEIATQVAAIQAVTGEAVEEMQTVAQVIERVNEVAAAIATAVEEQGAATEEIGRNVQQAAAGTQDVSRNIEGVSHAADQSGQTAREVLDMSRELSQQAETLNREVATFLKSVRSE